MAPENLQTKKSQNRTPLFIGIGCVAVLLIVCCVGVALVYFAGETISQMVAGAGIPGLAEPTTAPEPTTAALPPGPLSPRTPGAPAPTTAAPPAQPTQSQGNPLTGGVGNLFNDALSKAKTASKFRIETAMLVGSTTNGKYAEEPLLDLKGMVDGKNSQFEGKGGLMGMLSGGTGSVQIVVADGKTYMTGVSMFGLTDPKTWYVMKDASSTSGFDSFAKPDSFDSFLGDTKSTDFKKIRSESVDGQSCDVYMFDYKNTKNAALTGLLGTAKDKEDFSAIDKYEVNIWLCGDGYVHKFVLDMQAHNAKDANEKGGFKMNAHMWDFNNAAIKVTAPPNAKPFPGQ